MLISHIKRMMLGAGRMCLESGSYLMNFSSCKECSKNNVVIKSSEATADSDSDDEDGLEVVESISYIHQCGECQHQIASHKVNS